MLGWKQIMQLISVQISVVSYVKFMGLFINLREEGAENPNQRHVSLVRLGV